ncbi:hypothetical protein [Aequorivita echinoideorum]|uniref:Nif11 domain-containing protein n=1 Tax=Aequorivita echinoideorum TaxID=1549647 RepID=A0ABS5S3T7_9FLAO|nr:hypothetical protein [Aequorivita echinoideorum]MBT0607638.1 hypothetical protein [Aequorivita echinoideorum]
MKIDYSEEIRNFLKNNFEPVLSEAHENEETLKKSLSSIHSMLVSILPRDWVVESEVYEALTELGFKSFYFESEPVTKKNEEGETVVVFEGWKGFAYFLQPIN